MTTLMLSTPGTLSNSRGGLHSLLNFSPGDPTGPGLDLSPENVLVVVSILLLLCTGRK